MIKYQLDIDNGMPIIIKKLETAQMIIIEQDQNKIVFPYGLINELNRLLSTI